MNDSSLRVVIVTPDYPPMTGGMGESAHRIASNLSRQGIQVCVSVPHLIDKNSWPSSKIRNLGTHEVLDIFIPAAQDSDDPDWSTLRLGRLPLTLLMLQNYFSTWKPDIIHSFSLYPLGTVSGILAKELQVPLMVSARGNDITGNIFRPDIIGTIQMVCHNAQIITAVSSQHARYIGFSCPQAISKIRVVLNGVESMPSKNYRKLHKPSNEIIFSTACFPKPRKNLDVLINAFCHVNRKHPLTRLLIVGPINNEDVGLIRRRSKSIILEGQKDSDLAKSSIRNSDVFVLPSTFEGCSNAMLHAMANEVPIIASGVGGARDLITHGKNGLLFEPLDVKGLVSCMEKMLNSGFRKKLGRSNNSIIRSASEEACEWRQLYTHAIQASQN